MTKIEEKTTEQVELKHVVSPKVPVEILPPPAQPTAAGWVYETSEYKKGLCHGQELGRAWATRLIANLSYLNGVVEQTLEESTMEGLTATFFDEGHFLPELRNALRPQTAEWNTGLVRGFTEGAFEQLNAWDYTTVAITVG